MPPTVFSAEQLAELSKEQRLALIELLWDSLEGESIPLPDSHVAELNRRMETYEQDKSRGKSWETVRKRIERQKS